MRPEDIKSLRGKLGYTQSELADKVGVSLRTLQNYENGKTSPNAEVIMKFTALDPKSGATYDDIENKVLEAIDTLNKYSEVAVSMDSFEELLDKLKLRWENMELKKLLNEYQSRGDK